MHGNTATYSPDCDRCHCNAKFSSDSGDSATTSARLKNTATIESIRVDDNGRCSGIESNSRLSIALASSSEQTFELHFYLYKC